MDQSLGLIRPGPQLSGAKGHRTAVLMMVLAAFLWGSGNVANKTVLSDLDPFAAVAGRNLVGLLVLSPFALKQLLGVKDFAAWIKSVLLPSILFCAGILCQQRGFQSTTVTNASFLVNACSVLTPIVAFVFLRDRIGPMIGIAAALTLLGAFLMSGADRTLASMNAGDLACLVAAVFYAGWIVALSRHAVRHGQAMATIFVHCAVTLVAAIFILMVFAPKQPGIWTQGLPEVLYLGVFSTAVPFVLMTRAQERLSASTAAVLGAAESLFGAGGGFVLLGERLGLTQTLGAMLIFAAIVIAGVAVPTTSVRGAVTKMPRASGDPARGLIEAVGFGRMALLSPNPPPPYDPDLAGMDTADTDYHAANYRDRQKRSAP